MMTRWSRSWTSTLDVGLIGAPPSTSRGDDPIRQLYMQVQNACFPLGLNFHCTYLLKASPPVTPDLAGAGALIVNLGDVDIRAGMDLTDIMGVRHLDIPLVIIKRRWDQSSTIPVQPYHPQYGIVVSGPDTDESVEQQMRRTLMHLFSRRNLDRLAHDANWPGEHYELALQELEGWYTKEAFLRLPKLSKPYSMANWIEWANEKWAKNRN